MDDQIERTKEILKSHGIGMKVSSCGCCQSPWVTFKYNGETLLNDEVSASFDTEEPPEPTTVKVRSTK